MTFKEWLDQHKNNYSTLSNFAYDVDQDEFFYNNENLGYDEIAAHLKEVSPDEDVLKMFAWSYSIYQEDLKGRKVKNAINDQSKE